MPRQIARQTGFTLIELLVAMAVIGVLVALLMPAVQSARASARRIMCANQLRQLGLGLHLYHDAHTCFPPGAYLMGSSFPIQTGWGWGAMILPSIEQSALYDSINFGSGTAVGNNLQLIATPIASWRCPSEVGPDQLIGVPATHPPFDLASGNYCGSAGVLTAMSCMTISKICDGTSKTFLLGERVVQTGSNGSLPFTSAWCGDVAFQDGYESTAVPYLLASRLFPLNGSLSNPNCFGSRHTGGANFVMADGSLHFVNDSIDGQVYQALGTACGHEVVSFP